MFTLLGPRARALRQRARHAQGHQRRSARSSRRSGPSRSASGSTLGDGRVLVTTPALYRRRVAPHPRPAPPGSSTCCSWATRTAAIEGTLGFDAAMASGVGPLRHPAHRPRGHGAAALHQRDHGHARRARSTCTRPWSRHHATGTSALDLHDDDVFWCTADPGWVTGTSYGIIAPLTHGVTSIVDEADFDAERWYRILQDQRVTRLVHGAHRPAHAHAGRASTWPASTTCRGCGSWPAWASRSTPRPSSGASEALGLPVHDNWWQTETGGIMIANLAGAEVRPGSMGRPLPGVETAILARGPDGRACVDARRSGRGRRAARRRGRAGPAARLAVDVPRLPARRRALSGARSPAAGTSPATSPAATRTAGCGSWAGPTT